MFRNSCANIAAPFSFCQLAAFCHSILHRSVPFPGFLIRVPLLWTARVQVAGTINSWHETYAEKAGLPYILLLFSVLPGQIFVSLGFCCPRAEPLRKRDPGIS